MIERKADAVAVMGFGVEEPSLNQLMTRNLPLVFVDVGPDRPGVSLLKVDYQKGIQQGVEHLAALGHRRIAFIAGPHDLHSAQSRLSAFIHSHAEWGIPLDQTLLVEGDHTMEGGFQAAAKLIGIENPPTAVMCSNDLTAFGLMHKLHRAGLRVPLDLSVVGFDDIHLASLMIPPLTSIQLSRNDLARAAVSALRAHVEGREANLEYQIETRLVVRESTSNAPVPELS
jgi:LacI family transcriptional regulator